MTNDVSIPQENAAENNAGISHKIDIFSLVCISPGLNEIDEVSVLAVCAN